MSMSDETRRFPNLAPLRHADQCRRGLFIEEDRKCPARRQGDAIDPKETLLPGKGQGSFELARPLLRHGGQQGFWRYRFWCGVDIDLPTRHDAFYAKDVRLADYSPHRIGGGLARSDVFQSATRPKRRVFL
jgi:hypothetical protein